MSRTTLWLLLALLLPVREAVAQELGRLFFTPEQRAALDERRKARLPDKPAAVVVSPTTRINGYVRRSSGKSTLWVDGDAVREGRQPDGLNVRGAGDPSRVTVILGESRRRVDMRVGGLLERDTGEVKDVIGDGQIRIQRRAR